jgi:hypothetical protein
MKVTREQIIDRLVDNSIDNIHTGQVNAWLRDVLLTGWEGYRTLSNDDLAQLYLEEIDDTDEIEIKD